MPIADNHTHLDSIGDVLPPAPTAPPAAARAGGDDRFGGDRDAADRALGHRDAGHRDAGADPWAPGGRPSVTDHVVRARRVGVDRMIQVGCDLPAARWTDTLLRAGHPGPRAPGAGETSAAPAPGPGPDPVTRALLGAVAIHPNEATRHAGVDEVGPDGLAPRREGHHGIPLDEAIAEIAAIARGNPRVRAIGETGMDLFRSGPQGAQVQRRAFRDHIALAKELDLALQIHDRDAHAEVVEVLRRDGAPERTVFHCFSGDVELARVCAEHGWYASFAGPVTYPANEDLRAALRALPPDLLMLETDAPYLTPHPFRGAPNAPYAVAHTARAVAQITGTPLETVCAQVSRVTESVYGRW